MHACAQQRGGLCMHMQGRTRAVIIGGAELVIYVFSVHAW